MTSISLIQGPNLNLLGEREPQIYGHLSLNALHDELIDRFPEHDIRCFQSNYEGAIIDAIHDARKWANGIVINAGAFSHTSYAIHDAIKSVSIPCLEVHLSNVYAREHFRHTSVIASACVGQISGLGKMSYHFALEYLIGLDDLNAEGAMI
jgi:3-dehydroquinate dehydratase-2